MTLEHSDRALVASPKFRRNFSSLVVDSHSAWNTNWGAAFRTAPQHPWNVLIPSDAKFWDPTKGLDPSMVVREVLEKNLVKLSEVIHQRSSSRW